MTPTETIDECINQIQIELKGLKFIKDNPRCFEPTFGGVNDVTKKEIDDMIVNYQKHLDNLNLLKKDLDWGKI